MSDYNAIEKELGVNLFNKRGITLVKGRNARVWDQDGKEYIDCTTGHGVANIGHAHPEVAKAVAEQAAQLITCSGSFSNDKRAALMQKLIDLSPASLRKVFLCNSGAEAVEAALKFARVSSAKNEFICAMRSFHGRTMGALSATFNPKYKKPFEPLVPGFRFVPYNNPEKLRAAVTDNTAAILLEVVQGEGGVHPGTAEYFDAVKRICTENNILLIIDEVQTGFGRTGKLFACEHFDLEPDLLCLAKSIAGGIPMGAVLCSDKINVSPGQHGSTFGGNPLACAAALATIEILTSENLPQEAEKKGRYFREKFTAAMPGRVRELRQIGLMIGIELKEKVQPYIVALQERGVLAMPAGNTVLRLLPPLTISYRELDKVLSSLLEVLN